MDYISPSLVGSGENPQQGISGWGSGEEQNSAVQQFQMATQLFQQQFKNLLGRDPTPQELGGFQSQALTSAINAPGDLTYGDASGIANSYIQSSFGPQAAQYQQQQQTQQLGNSENMIQNLINQTMGNTASQFSNPNSQLYQKFSGNMNNMGITPSSGAFQAGAGSTIANSGMNAANEGLQSIGIPGIQGIAQTGQIPYQQSFGSGQQALGNLEGLNNFQLQTEVGQMLQNEMQPSTAQKDIGMASGAANALGGVGTGMAGMSQVTSYVCMELIKRGFICEMDMDDFHVHIMPALFKKGRAFWKYAMDGKRLVDAVNTNGVSWDWAKPLLFDRVMDEPDPCKAVDLYADACHQLCLSSDRSLWDERVFRTSLRDSIPFIPLLLTYKPFLEALWKCWRIKTLLVYDKPRCEAHRG